MASHLAKIDAAFVQVFINSAFMLPIAHENAEFVPKAGEAYAELALIPNNLTLWSMDGNRSETDGLFRVTLRYPTGRGAMAAKFKADEIMGAYLPGSRLAYDGVTVTVVSNSRQLGVSEEGWYKTIISIGYKAFIRR